MADIPSVIGLIAGSGRFPLLFAQAARVQGIKVIALAVKGDTSFLINFVSDEVRWISPRELPKLFVHFRDRGVKHILMAGQIPPKHLFNPAVMADKDMADFFQAIADWRCDTVFGAVADHLKKEGLELLDSTILLKEHLAPKGTLTRLAPTRAQLNDIDFGVTIAKQIGGLDIGQTVVIKDRAILAVEALEGTDQCILRGGGIARFGAVVVKTSKPNQDKRFDVPVIGPKTIRTMARVKAACLAIEAGKTLIIDRERTVALAERFKISLIAA